MSTTSNQMHRYFVPTPSPYPALLSAALFLLSIGVIFHLDALGPGLWILGGGTALLLYVLFHWFGRVIEESESGTYALWEDRSFRLGMIWFIASEVVFFGALFGILFYEREISVPWLASFSQRFTPWPGFTAQWPSAGPKGHPFTPMSAWGIPAINTLLLLSSGATITMAHGWLLKGRRQAASWGVLVTVCLGALFLFLQGREFYHAYTVLGLTLHSGVYGATFFLLTGFHGLHVTIGVIMLSTLFLRLRKGHFSAEHMFAFEAVSWYWHFVDVVWLMLYVFVYWLR